MSVLSVLVGSIIFLLSLSYHSLLELHYGDWMHKPQTAREGAIEVGLSFREMEQSLNTKLFLNKNPRWEIEAPHQSVILHEDVSACCQVRAEGGGEVYLMRPPVQPTKA